MKIVLTICIALFLTACDHLQAKREFPEIPASLEVGCSELMLVPEGTEKLSEVLTIVTTNYSNQKECAVKVKTWQDWYKTQKKIFNSVD